MTTMTTRAMPNISQASSCLQAHPMKHTSVTATTATTSMSTTTQATTSASSIASASASSFDGVLAVDTNKLSMHASNPHVVKPHDSVKTIDTTDAEPHDALHLSNQSLASDAPNPLRPLTPPPSASKMDGHNTYYCEGRDFYDDHYHDTEQEEVESLEDEIDFNRIKFFGRQTQLEDLRLTFQHMMDHSEEQQQRVSRNDSMALRSSRDLKQDSKRLTRRMSIATALFPTNVCMVRGLSGCGKSSMVQQFATNLASAGSATMQPYYCKGKFDELSGADPLSGFTAAFNHFVAHFQDRTDAMRQEVIRIRKALRSTQQEQHCEGDDSQLRSYVRAFHRPLEELLFASAEDGLKEQAGNKNDRASSSTAQTADSVHSTTDSDDKNTGFAWNRLKYIVQTLCKVIATKERPFIMFIDDLQWADHDSLDLISTLLTERDMPYFFFIGSYRSDEVDPFNHGDGDVDFDEEWSGPINDRPQPTQRQPQRPQHQFDAPQHPLSNCFRDIMQVRSIPVLDVPNLTMEETTDFLKMCLKMEDDGGNDTNADNPDAPNDADDDDTSIHALTNIVFAKTRGNVYFTIQMIEELIRKNILYFSRMTFSWEWNLKGVDVNVGLSNDVVEAIISKIQTLSAVNTTLQSMLKVTAYTNRSAIHMDILSRLLAMEGISLHPDEFNKVLDQAVVEGLFQNTMGSKEYRFAHDRIQQAALSLVPEGPQRDEYRYHMGHRLLKLARLKRFQRGMSSTMDVYHEEVGPEDDTHDCCGLTKPAPPGPESADTSPDDNGWMWYAAVDHFNATQNVLKHDPLFLARLNLQVGQKAVRMAAYEAASNYLCSCQKSFAKLKEPWSNHYQLTLELYRTIVEVEFCQSHFERGNKFAEVLLEHAHSFEDKLPTYISLTAALGRNEEHDNALQLNRKVLIKMGSYPKRFILIPVLRDLMFVRRYVARHSDEDILRLPCMRDKRRDKEMAVLNELSTQAVYCDNIIQFLSSSLRMVRICIRYGHSGYSALAFGKYAMFLANVKDQVGARRLANLTKLILQKSTCRRQQAVLEFGLPHWVDAWNSTHEQTVNAYKAGHVLGMQAGDVDSAFLNSLGAIHHAHGCGYPLLPLEIATEELLEQMFLYRVRSTASMTEQILITIQHLTMPSASGIDWVELANFRPVHDGHSEKYRLLFGFLGRCELGVYFGNYRFAHIMSKKMWGVLPRDTAYIVSTMRMFYAGIAASGMARTTRRPRFFRQARRWHRRLSSMNKAKGNTNIHRQLIMLADIKAATRCNEAVVKACFDEAIQAALDQGHLHDAALATELLAEYYVNMIENPNQYRGNIPSQSLLMTAAQHQMTRARNMYAEWGAKAKVEHMEYVRGEYVDDRMGSDGQLVGRPSLQNTNMGSSVNDVHSLSGRISLDMDEVFSTITPSHKSTSESTKARRQSAITRVSIQLPPSNGTSKSNGFFDDSSSKKSKLSGDDMSAITDPSATMKSSFRAMSR